MKAHEIATRAAELVGGDRDRQHGSKLANHLNIAAMWNAYLGDRLLKPLDATDVALMMVTLKVARTKSGSHNPDDYIDSTGYSACAGEMAEIERATANAA